MRRAIVAFMAVALAPAMAGAQDFDPADFTLDIETYVDPVDELSERFQPMGIRKATEGEDSFVFDFQFKPAAYFTTNSTLSEDGDSDLVENPSISAQLLRSGENLNLFANIYAERSIFHDDTSPDFSLAAASLGANFPLREYENEASSNGTTRVRSMTGRIAASAIFAETDTFDDWLKTIYRGEARVQYSEAFVDGNDVPIAKNNYRLTIRQDTENPTGNDTFTVQGNGSWSQRIGEDPNSQWSTVISASLTYRSADRDLGDRSEFDTSLGLAFVRRVSPELELSIGSRFRLRESDEAGRDYGAIEAPLYVAISTRRTF